MKNPHCPAVRTMVLFCIVLFLNSCSKDTDLLTKGVLTNANKNGVAIENYVINDNFDVPANSSVILDVLANDEFPNLENVIITETSSPKNGTVVINEDYTITYTSHNAIESTGIETAPAPEVAQNPSGTASQEIEQPAQNETPQVVEPSVEPDPVIEPAPVVEPAPTPAPVIETPEPEVTPEPEPAPVVQEQPQVPSTTESSTSSGASDNFTYTTEVQNEDGTTTTETGNVTINGNGEVSANVDGNSRFVTTSGSAGNDGKSESSAWSLAHAVKNAQPGQTVFVKKGVYRENDVLSFTTNGSSSNRIIFMGYNNSPGDIVSESYSSFDYGNSLSGSPFPIIEGNLDRVFFLQSQYVELHNLAVSGASTSPGSSGHYAFEITGNNNVLNNCVFADMGTRGNNVYNGFGIVIRGGDNNQIVNCYGEDVGAEAYSIWDGGTDNLIAYCDFRNDDYNLQTDYQYTTKQNTNGSTTERNVIKNNRAYRYHTGFHIGHGLDNKGGSYNVWENNYLYRLPIEAVLATTHHSTFRNNVLEGDESCEIKISSGAHHNTFDGNFIEVDYTGLVFINQADSSIPDSSVNQVDNGHDNVIINNIFVGGQRPISVGTGARSGASCNNNTIANNIFYGQTHPIMISMDVNGMNLTNNIFSNNPTTVGTWLQHTGGNLGITVKNCNFYNNGFPTPGGSNFSNISTSNPKFVNANANNFALSSDSPLIDAGQSTSYTTSYNGKSRPSGSAFDIGAYEN